MEAKELTGGTLVPVRVWDRVVTVQLKINATPGAMEVKELTVETLVPVRAWDRVALGSAREEETGVPLGGPGGAGVVNGWRVSGEVRAAAVMVAVPVAEAAEVAEAEAEVVAVAEVEVAEAEGNNRISDNRTLLSYNRKDSP
jgi:hypothetical protein